MTTAELARAESLGILVTRHATQAAEYMPGEDRREVLTSYLRADVVKLAEMFGLVLVDPVREAA